MCPSAKFNFLLLEVSNLLNFSMATQMTIDNFGHLYRAVNPCYDQGRISKRQSPPFTTLLSRWQRIEPCNVIKSSSVIRLDVTQ